MQELAEPLKSDGGKLTIPKTWITGPQIIRMTEKTPPQFVYKRPGKGGGTWDYVTVSYVQRVLDYVFGFNWDFDILEHGKEADHVWVRAKLTVRSPDGKHAIVKTQFGRSEVKHKKDGGLLDYGNDLKAASSDALKKCASMLGIARDIYGKGDYKQETHKEPRQEPVVQLDDKGKVDAAITTLRDRASTDAPAEVNCKGINGKGCAYGNDVDSLPAPVADYSIKHYGKPLCKECQKDALPLRKK